MRNAFLLILLVNILAFAYQHWVIEPGSPVAADAIGQDIPLL